jgi:hypothetical protein
MECFGRGRPQALGQTQLGGDSVAADARRFQNRKQGDCGRGEEHFPELEVSAHCTCMVLLRSSMMLLTFISPADPELEAGETGDIPSDSLRGFKDAR